MAINSLVTPCDKTALTSFSHNISKPAGNLASSRLVKINFATEGSICSAASIKRGRKTDANIRSPYLNGDNVHLLSQFTEKKFVHKKGNEFVSSFPLAVNIYKANSDEFKSLKKAGKKTKKSVLTLPNDQAPMPQRCTVSDMNDSEYFNQDEEHSKKIKKRNPAPRTRKYRSKDRDYEFYDRDAKYCSQLNIDLDCSSTDMIQSYANKKRTGKSKFEIESKEQGEEKPDPHDVWAVLRNINRFQFRPSPPESQESFITPKKKKGCKRRNNRKDLHVVETRTEEYAYISSFEVDSRSPRSFSSSSFDRVTVIDKRDDFSKICKEFEKRMVKTKNLMRGANIKPQDRIQSNRAILNRNTTKPNIKSLLQKANSPKAMALEYNPKKQLQNSCGDTLNIKKNKLEESKPAPVTDTTKNELGDLVNTETNDNQFIKESDEDEIIEHEFIYSGNSGSSKAAVNNKLINKAVSDKTKLKSPSGDYHNPINGITKVILNKGEKTPSFKKPETPKRKRQVTVMLTSSPAVPKSTVNTVIPKLTQADIKRRLAKLKFPIVVLGKDQLSSNYVLNPEPTQFNGMNEHIWPFMAQWQNNESDKQGDIKLKTKTNSVQKKKFSPQILEFNKTQKGNRGFTAAKHYNTDKKLNNDFKTIKGKMEQKRITPPAELQQQTQSKKPKPIRQLKDKMLKLLYKKSSVLSFVGEKNETGGYSDVKIKSANKVTNNKVDASTDTRVRTGPKDMSRNSPKSLIKASKQVATTKQPWSKARWASDFIDNVIRKIKNGVYYTHDIKLPNQKNTTQHKEVEIQTVAVDFEGNPVIQSISKVTITKKQDPITIPGFDDTLPALEIKTINKNEISVKNCVTNIMVHFDVTIPTEPVINVTRSSSLIKVDATKSQTKIFKCKTSIINSMLPAELCYIIPKMMRSIVESGQTLALSQVPVDKIAPPLPIITEINRCSSPEILKLPLLPHLRMTLELQMLINGLFSCKTVSKHKPKVLKATNDLSLAKELLPILSRGHLFACVVEPSSSLNDLPKQDTFAPVQNVICKPKLNTCMTLQPFIAYDLTLVQAYKPFNVMNFLQKISSYVTYNISSCLSGFNNFLDNKFTINLTTVNSQGLEDKLSINLSRLMLNNVNNISEIVYKKALPAIKLVELETSFDKNPHFQAPVSKIKKKGFIKLYRKCKSTSSISGEKIFTSLNKITNLDEFFQVLGASNLFSGVFDSVYSHKIMSSLKEMKSWITDINPTQALLVLLLMNKKDTPSLVRFRPVLLQGIAVNRITRAHELDMEIEVIERENLKRLSQYEGISYLPESTENQDILLEELCWIAKTTASDYQRTFDESSEKLLKSLLQKRKKLNPSYLRVMARYVGLGLLKTPNKK